MATWKGRRIAVAIACLALLIVGSGVAVWLDSGRQRAQVNWPLRSDMHNVGLAIHMYRKDHGGNAPKVLSDIVREHYLLAPEILEPEGKEIVYRPLRADAPSYSVLAYYWPPWVSGSDKRLGFVALFNDLSVAWVDFEEPDALSAAARVRSRTEAWWLKEILANVGRQVSAFQNSHGGTYPPSIDIRSAEAGRRAGGEPVVELIYSPPTGEARDTVIAFFWPPVFGGTAALFGDLKVEWLPTETDGNVANPRTGKPIRQYELGETAGEP